MFRLGLMPRPSKDGLTCHLVKQGLPPNAKIQESTHVFIADYVSLDSRITAETSRMVINGKRYEILLIDNPMEMGSGSQLEFYLKFTGGQ